MNDVQAGGRQPLAKHWPVSPGRFAQRSFWSYRVQSPAWESPSLSSRIRPQGTHEQKDAR